MFNANPPGKIPDMPKTPEDAPRMGRPPLRAGEATERVTIRVASGDLEEIRQLADGDVSSWIRGAIARELARQRKR